MTRSWPLFFMLAVVVAASTPKSHDSQCSDPVMPLPKEQILLQTAHITAPSSMEESSSSQCKKYCKPNVDKGKFTWGQLCFAPEAHKKCGGCKECVDAEEPLCGVGTFIEFGDETTCEACPTGRFTAVPGVTKCKRCKGTVSKDAASCFKKGGIKPKGPQKAGKGRTEEKKPDVIDDVDDDTEELEPPPPEPEAPPGGSDVEIISPGGSDREVPDSIGTFGTKTRCVDNSDASDSYGTNCTGYAENPDFCAYPGDDEDFTATQMCCACREEEQKEWLEDREENDFVIDES